MKKKEKEERDKAREAEVEKAQEKSGAVGNRNQTTPKTPTNNTQQNGLWYFYNPLAVSQGKQQFQQQWGKRENVDNWRRANQTVLATTATFENAEQEQAYADSLAAVEALNDSITAAEEQKNDSAQNDPHRREYYLAQIPFTSPSAHWAGKAGNSQMSVILDCTSISAIPAQPPKLPSIWKGEWASSRLG